MDDRSPEARSNNMARIKSSQTKPEMYIRSQLHSMGFRFKVNSNLVPGKPDLLFTKKKVAVFVHGCFWHSHPGCKFASTPLSNQEYWGPKMKRNIDRDLETIVSLNDLGFRVLVVWECTIKKMIRDKDFSDSIFKLMSDFISDCNERFSEF